MFKRNRSVIEFEVLFHRDAKMALVIEKQAGDDTHSFVLVDKSSGIYYLGHLSNELSSISLLQRGHRVGLYGISELVLGMLLADAHTREELETVARETLPLVNRAFQAIDAEFEMELDELRVGKLTLKDDKLIDDLATEIMRSPLSRTVFSDK